MKCPKCGKPLHKDFCMHCGYMLNGNVIDTKKKIEASKLEKYLGDDFDKIIHNENIKQVFILGPLYFSYRNFLFLGTSLTLLDIYLIYKSREFAQNFLNTPLFSIYLNFDIPIMLITFLLLRLFYVMFSNEIYIKLLTKKLAKSNDDIVNLKVSKKVNILLSIIYILIIFIIFLFIKSLT